ncbi:MAG: mycothiol synthase, partial [Leucobacter sp.]
MVSVIATLGGIEEARPLIERAEHADGTSPISDQALLAVAQHQRELVLFRGTQHNDVSEADVSQAEPVAVGVVGQGELDLVVDPAARGRGIGTAALQELVSRADGELLAWAHGDNPAADALLTRAGFSPVRSLFRMKLDPSLLPATNSNPFAVSVPEGFALRSFGAPTDPANWVRVNAAAFADHPEQGRVTESDFALMREESWFNAEDLLLLEAPSPGLAGSTWIKTVRNGDNATGEEADVETELYAIGVDPEFAGQGLGRVLLDATLARMATHSPNRVTLYVDGENERAVR